MNRAGIIILVVACLATIPDRALAEDGPGRTMGLEFSVGTQGILSFEELGIRLPMGKGNFFVELKARFLSSLTWATFSNLQTTELVSFHPDVVGGLVSFGGVSPMLFGVLRMYGQSDIMLGYTFTPWDSLAYGVPNLVGDNLTYAFWGCFGFELFTAPTIAVFLDAGGGFKSIRPFGAEDNPYVTACSWLGSGFGIKMGMRFYL